MAAVSREVRIQDVVRRMSLLGLLAARDRSLRGPAHLLRALQQEIDRRELEWARIKASVRH